MPNQGLIGFPGGVSSPSYTPTWSQTSGTAPGVGNGSIAGRYIFLGPKVVQVWIGLIMGSTTTYGDGTGGWTFSLPSGLTTAVPGSLAVDLAVGSAYGLHNGTAFRNGVAIVNDVSTVMRIVSAAGSNDWRSTVPHTWASTHALSIAVTVPLA